MTKFMQNSLGSIMMPEEEISFLHEKICLI